MSASNGKLETAFQQIESGNAYEGSEDWWSAADSFGKAMGILMALSLEVSNVPVGADEATNDKVQEQMKISELYGTQSREYRLRARDCFIKALTFENDEDRKRKDRTAEKDGREALCVSLSTEEARRRLRIFSCLYSKKPLDELVPEEKKLEKEAETAKGVYQKQDSLEERLQELNRTLPSGFKTSKERMADINRGLSRLGLTLYSQEDTPRRSPGAAEVPASEEEQVEQIMAQARDEAKFEAEQDKGEDYAGVNIADSSSDDFSDDEEEFDSDESRTHQKKRKAAKRRIAKAQVKLTELVALLDFKPGAEEVREDDISDKSDTSSQGEFDLDQGRNMLIKTKLYLDKALRELSAE